MTKRSSLQRHAALMLPGMFVALFALGSIALPVGRDGLGAAASSPLSVWAADIHDGFWARSAGDFCASQSFALTGERALAHRLAALGEADRAMTIFRRIGVDRRDWPAIWYLNSTLVVDARWDEAERTAIASDEMFGTGVYRNNLAWHYTQADIRTAEALDLALGSVADQRGCANVDTLAWAYYRDGQTNVARRVAREAIELTRVSVTDDDARQSRESSQRLLTLLAN